MTTKKKVIIALSVLLIFMITYIVIWNIEARSLRSALDNISPEHITLSYDDVRTEGFPLRVKMVVDHPVISVNAEALCRKHCPPLLLKNIYNIETWTETFAFPAGITLSRVPLSGGITVTAAPEQPMEIESVIDSETLRTQISSDKYEWIFNRLFLRDVPEDAHAAARFFIGHTDMIPFTGEMHIRLKGFTLTIPGIDGSYTIESSEALIGSDTATFSVSGQVKNVGSDGVSPIPLIQQHYAKITGRKSTQSHVFQPLTSADVHMTIDASDPSKRQATYRLSGTHQDVRFDIDMIQSFHPEGMMNMHVSGSQQVEEEWFHRTKNDVVQYISDYIADEKNHPDIEAYIASKPLLSVDDFKKDPEAFARTVSENISDIIPRIYEFGESTFSINMNGSYSDQTFMKHAVLHHFLFDSQLYSLEAENISDNKDVLSVRIRLKNYKKMIEDAAGYVVRMTSIAHKIFPRVSGNFHIRDGFSNALAAMLENIGKREGDSLEIDVVNTGQKLMVGRRSLQQFAGEAMLLLSPYIRFGSY